MNYIKIVCAASILLVSDSAIASSPGLNAFIAPVIYYSMYAISVVGGIAINFWIFKHSHKKRVWLISPLLILGLASILFYGYMFYIFLILNVF